MATQNLVARLRANGSGPPTLQHNLAQQLKSFVGRAGEIEDLCTLVQTERLVTLLGIGGVGKSRLSQAVAHNALHDFADGVWFVPLANVEAGVAAADRIALAMAAAIGFPITDTQTPLAELARHLADKRLLLVLDNWDHLTAAAESVLYALLQGTQLHVLATSRTRLLIDGERVIYVEGLPVAEAVTLFVERARRILPTFATPNEAAVASDIAAICEAVAGLPLGIELAASWVEHFSVAEIGQSIAQIEIEPAQAQGLVDRHHRLSTIFEYSWRLIEPRQQRILARFAIFRSGFDRAAAAVVAESSLSDLSTLIGHSLVQRVGAGRYDLHPLIREFAEQKLDSADSETLHRRHSAHFLGLLVASEPATRAVRLQPDFENLRSAWQEAVRTHNHSLIQQSLLPFSAFISQFGLMADGHTLLAEAVTQFSQDARHNALVAHLLDRQWSFTRAIQGIGSASALLHRVLALTDELELQVRSHIDLANGYAEAGDWEQADYHFDQVEALTQDSPDPRFYIKAVESRIHITAIHFRGDFGAGIERLQGLLALMDDNADRLADEKDLRTRVFESLALVAVRYGDYALALRCGADLLARANALTHQYQKIGYFLNIALAEQFAGMYPQAIAHNLEGLALAEKIGAADDMGLLKANLCLSLRQHGDYAEALAYGVEAIAILQKLGITRQEGQARNRVGHTLLALERWSEADAAYGDALRVWEPIQHPNLYEAVAGRAVAAFCLGRRAEALAAVRVCVGFCGSAWIGGHCRAGAAVIEL